MRYFLALLLLLVVAVIGIAGFRGDLSRKPPLEIFPDMDRQAKVRPQKPSGFFSDGFGSRPPVVGTVARGTPYQDIPRNTGQEPGTTNFVELGPIPLTAELLARGRERYRITCLPCHGGQADGNGISKKYGMVVVGNLHDPRMVEMGDGELFHVIGNGRNLMQGYAANIDIEDRWAIVAYVRALQLSRLGTIDDVPSTHRTELEK